MPAMLARPHENAQPKYRADIDGLRGLSILAVLGYHAAPSALKGGFVGVDIFFVISGFLVSTIIFSSLERGGFNFREFYIRRIKRIFPALAVVLCACVAIGWFVLIDEEFSELGEQIGAAGMFASNLLLWRGSGYFDVTANLKPLLHLWSLGVEEQFYICWPLILFVAWKRKWDLPITIVSIAAGSFILNVVAAMADPVGDFYSPFTRIWELLIGACVAWLLGPGKVRFPTSANLRSMLGSILLLVAILVTNRDKSFPGWWALLPTMGAFLLISAGPDAIMNRRVFSQRILVWFGLISYPLYLWHWPLLSFSDITLGTTTAAQRIVLMSVATALAWLTYRFVETPIRHGRPREGTRAPLAFFRKPEGIAATLCLALILLTSIGIGAADRKVKSRLSDMGQSVNAAATDWDFPGNIQIGGRRSQKTLFFGDSRIQQYFARVQELSKQNLLDDSVVFYTAGGCAPVAGITRKSIRTCGDFAASGFQLAYSPDVEKIVIGGSWLGFIERGDYYKLGDSSQTTIDVMAATENWIFENFRSQLADLARRQKKIFIVLGNPGGPEADPRNMVKNRLSATPTLIHLEINRETYLHQTQAIENKLINIAESVGATVIDPVSWMCGSQTCPTVDANNTPIYKDATHLRSSYVRYSVRFFDKLLMPAQGDAVIGTLGKKS